MTDIISSDKFGWNIRDDVPRGHISIGEVRQLLDYTHPSAPTAPNEIYVRSEKTTIVKKFNYSTYMRIEPMRAKYGWLYVDENKKSNIQLVVHDSL